MTVPTTDNKQFASGNGVTTIFYFAYRLLLASDIQVYVNNTIVGTGNYTVAINSNGIGGSVTFNTAPSGGSNNILIYRFVDYLQETHFPNESDFNQISLEDVVDKLTMECQQLQEEVGRCIIAPLTDPNIPLLSLPAPEANTAIGWDPTGTFLADLPLTGILGPQGPSGPSGPAGINAALIPIETQTVSEVNFVNFVTGIDSTYSEYQLHYYGVISTVDGSTGRFQITQNGGVSWVINSYRWTLASLSSGGQVINSNNNDSSMEWAATLSNDTFKGSSGYINFWNPSATNTRKLFDTKCLAGAPTNAATYTGFSELDTGPGSAMNGIRIFSDPGGTVSGTFTLYGVTTTGSLAVPGPTGPTGPTGPSGGGTPYANGSFQGYNSFLVHYENDCTITVDGSDNWSYDVVFDTPTINTEYEVNLEYKLGTGDLQILSVEAKTTSGFIIQANSITGSQNPSAVVADISFTVRV